MTKTLIISLRILANRNKNNRKFVFSRNPLIIFILTSLSELLIVTAFLNLSLKYLKILI